MALYVIIAVLVGLLGIATIIAMAIGLLSIAGVLRLDRCEHCGHLTVNDARTAPQSCMYCRHERLTHPLATLHHVHLPVGHS